MPQTVTSSQLQSLQQSVQAGGAAAAADAYSSLYAQGYNYAGWAEGVARGDSFAGNTALKYLQETAIMGMGGDQWGVRGQGNERVTSVHDTQRDAIDRARGIAINQQSELLIQGRDGKIRERNSYGDDPFPPKG